MTIFLCGGCSKPLAVPDANFCCYCGVRLQPLANPPDAGKPELKSFGNQPFPPMCAHTKANPIQKTEEERETDGSYLIEDLHSLALRIRERVIRMNSNARRGFRAITDGTDSGAVSRDRFIEAVCTTWGFTSIPEDFVRATVDRYLIDTNGFVSYDTFSSFITNGPEPLDVCSDAQTELASILLPIQESFLRKHNTPHAAFLSISAKEPGVVSIREIRTHIERYLRTASLTTISDAVFEDVVRRSANIEGNQLTYHDFYRMLSYPYVDKAQWRQPSAAPRAIEDDSHPYRRYY